MRVLILAFIAIVISFQVVEAQRFAEEFRVLKPAATKALPTLKKLVTEKNYKIMGFESYKEVSSAELGMPFKEFMVRLDSLQKYTPGDSVPQLLNDTGQASYPILVGENVRSAITLAKVKEEWKAVSFGGSNLYKIFDTIRQESSKSSGVEYPEYFIVRVPSLNLFFLSYYKAEDLFLVPIFDSLEFDFKAGESKAAREVFETILQVAKEHDGLPR